MMNDDENDDDPGSKRRRNAKKSPGPFSSMASSLSQTPPAKRIDASGNNDEEGRRLAPAADMVVLVIRKDLYDACHFSEEEDATANGQMTAGASSVAASSSPMPGYPRPPIGDYHYVSSSQSSSLGSTTATPFSSSTMTLAICRLPPCPTTMMNQFWMEQQNVFDKTVPNPHDRSIRKYWNQRRRLFSRFDQGVQLDQEGWFSVTPEQIADLVAARTVDLHRLMHQQPHPEPQQLMTSVHFQQQQKMRGMVVLDAFGGCGGNTIAFAKQAHVSQVVCVDIDRTKLRNAANNAAIYDIPANKVVFIECNVLFLLEHCYKNGDFMLDQPIDTPEKAMLMMSAMPPPVETETTSHGYQIGGIDLLPRKIDAVFMDPPWGGVDYEVFGKNGYCLERHMRISRPANQIQQHPAGNDGVTDGFFDTFCTNQPRNKEERKAAFNCGLDEINCVNGAELLQLAATAATDALVIYDIPRNTSRTSLGQAALAAGYRGNCKLEEHFLNGRLKTITAYFGTDWRRVMFSD